MSNSSKDISQMLCFDIYFSTLSDKEKAKLSRKIKPVNPSIHPLLSGDVYATYMHHLSSEEKKRNDLQALLAFQKKSHWATDLQGILNNDYFALVLTDTRQIIQWANKSFPAMTGYPVNFAVGRTPRFLQGQNTSEATKRRIREQLALHVPFTETVTNYRKNKEEYLCKVTIYPLMNDKQTVTHFLALESEAVV